MKQAHTEQSVEHTDGQQNTGNHKKPDAPDAHGADRFGGTRAGAENIADTQIETARDEQPRRGKREEQRSVDRRS